MREPALILVLAVAGAGLLGCDTARRVGVAIDPGRPGMAERCADFMTAAMPSADLKIEKSSAETTGLRTIVAHIEGTRRDVPDHPPLAAECEFEDSILTAFRWTQGGPRP